MPYMPFAVFISTLNLLILSMSIPPHLYKLIDFTFCKFFGEGIQVDYLSYHKITHEFNLFGQSPTTVRQFIFSRPLLFNKAICNGKGKGSVDGWIKAYNRS